MSKETNGALRAVLGKGDVPTSEGKSTYNKKAIPFSQDNPVHVSGLDAITELFADPWKLGRSYNRGDLATDVSEFFIAVKAGKIQILATESDEEEDDEPSAPASEMTVKGLMRAYNRMELDAFAEEHGVEGAGDMPNKRAVAEAALAILSAAEGPDTETE